MAFPNNPTSPPVLELNDHAINTSCVGFWPLTQVSGTTATDISTGGNDGTAGGDPSWTSETVGNVATFDGAGDYFEFTNSQSQSGLTLSAWCKFETTWTSNSHIVSVADATTADYTSVMWKNSGGTMYLAARQADGTANDAIESSSSNDGNWHHVVGVFNGTSQVLYVDGVQAATNTATPSLTTTTRGRIGMAADSTPIQEFNGNIQNVRVFNTALSASDVELLFSRPWVGTDYDETFPYSPPVPSSMSVNTDALMTDCVGWWPLTETDDYVSGAADISGNSYTGTKNGTITSEPASLGTVASFDGSTGYFQHSNTLAQSFTDAFSVSFWARPNSDLSDQRAISNWYTSTPSDGQYNVWYDIGDGAKGWAAGIKDTGGSDTVIGNTTNSGVIGDWQHVCATWSSASTDYILYVDGVAIDTATVASLSSPTAGTTFMIGRITNASQFFDGDIQNVRVWSRALTADEVTLLYERPWEGESTYGDVFPNDPPPTLALGSTAEDDAINTDCVGWWPLLETDDYASGASDISVNGNNLTKAGTVTSEPSVRGTVGEFDGSTGELEYTGTMTDFESLTGSASFWFRIPSTTSNTIHTPLSVHKTNQLTDYLSFFIGDSTGNYADESISVVHAWGNALKVRAYYRRGHTYFHDDEWHHFAWTMDASSNAMYIDGVQVDLSYATGSASTGNEWIYSGVTNSVTVGARDYSASPARMDGQVSNVRIWNRALSATEVQSLYETPWIGSNYGAVAAIYNYIYRSKRFRRL